MSANKRRGTAFETEVATFLRSHGLRRAERRALSGTKDRGDIANVPGWVLECKNAVRMELATWIDEAKSEAANEDEFQAAIVEDDDSIPAWLAPVLRPSRWAVIMKRRGKNVGRAYVVMELEHFCALVAE